MKVKNMTSSKGNKIANQFVITDDSRSFMTTEYFQSYNSVIVQRTICDGRRAPIILLDRNKWDYSVTTGRYRNQFLGETKAETQRKIDSGEYTLTNLN